MKVSIRFILVLLFFCPIVSYADTKPDQEKVKLAFRVLDENFSLNNRTHPDLRRNQSLLPLAESAVSATLEFYPDQTEFVLKSIRTLYVEGNYYLHTEKLSSALQKLTLANELCERYIGLELTDPVQICEQLMVTDPILPALYSQVQHHLGLYHLSQIALNPKTRLINSAPSKKCLEMACHLRDVIDASQERFHNVPDNNVDIGDGVIFKRNLGHFYFETDQFDEAEKIYLDLAQIKDPFNQLLCKRQLFRVYQRKAKQTHDSELKKTLYKKAVDEAQFCLMLIKNHVGQYSRVSTVYKDIGNLYNDSDNPFRDVNSSLQILELAKTHCPNQLRITERYIREGLSGAFNRMSEREREEANSLRWEVAEEENAGLLKLLDDQKLHILNYEMLGDLYLEKKSYLLASALFSNAISLSLKVPDTEPFQKRLYVALGSVESCFLDEHNISIAKSSENYRLSPATIERHHAALEKLRNETEGLLKNNQSIEEIYLYTTQKYKEFIGDLIQETILVMGPPPTEDFAFVAFGSIGRGIANPYSDLEFAILLKDEKYVEYFKRLSELFHIRVTALGEAPIASFKIKSLDWLTLDDGPSGWGLMLDSGNIVGHIPLPKNFELTGTPEHLASIFDPSYTAVSSSEKASFYVSTLLFGKSDLVDQYRTEVDKILDRSNLRLQLADQYMEEFLEFYYTNMGSQWLKEWGQSYNIKHDFYRPFTFLLDSAAFRHGLRIITPWQVVDDLYKAGLIDEETRSLFKKILDEIGYLRLDTCIINKKQNYMMYVADDAKTGADENVNPKYFIKYEKISKLFEELFACQKKPL